MSATNAIFWNDKQIFSLNLEELSPSPKFKTLQFRLDPDEKCNRILRVYSCPIPSKITIAAQFSPSEQSIVLWDMEKDVEIISFTNGIECKVFHDSKGDVYVTEKGLTTICSQGIRLQAYKIEPVESGDSFFRHLDFSKGFRFDHMNHNWAFFNEYLSFSFSFLTLMKRIYTRDELNVALQPEVFDADDFNFLVNRKSCFTSDGAIRENSEMLQSVLSRFLQADPSLLE